MVHYTTIESVIRSHKSSLLDAFACLLMQADLSSTVGDHGGDDMTSSFHLFANGFFQGRIGAAFDIGLLTDGASQNFASRTGSDLLGNMGLHFRLLVQFSVVVDVFLLK